MAAFRHDPSIRVCRSSIINNVDWSVEPVITAYREFSYNNKRLGQVIRVALHSTPVLIEGVGLIACSDDGFIRFIKLSLDEVFWELRVAASIYSSPIYLNDKKAILVCTTGGSVLAISLMGKLLWKTSVEFPIYAGAIRSGSSIFVGVFNYSLYCLDVDTGRIQFQYQLPAPRGARVGGIAAFRDPYATPCVANDLVIAVCGESVVCVSPEGTLVWSVRFQGSIRSSPAFCSEFNTLVIASVDGRITLLDGGSGKLLKEFNCSAKIVNSPAISKGIACVGDESGKVYAIDIRMKEVKWVYEVGAALGYTSVTLTPADDFVFLSERGNAVCVSRDEGRFLWETSQNLQLTDHERCMHVTPIISQQGQMYCASYSGYLYRFDFVAME